MDDKRRAPNADEKVAALLLMYWDKCGDPIDFKIARQLTAHQICSLVEWHHEVPDVWTHDYHPTNLTPLLIARHSERTRKIDQPRIAKVRRALKKRAKLEAEAVEKSRETVRRMLRTGRVKMPSRKMTKPRGRFNWSTGRYEV